MPVPVLWGARAWHFYDLKESESGDICPAIENDHATSNFANTESVFDIDDVRNEQS